MSINQFLLKAFLVCAILLSQPFFTPTVMAQSAAPAPYAQKLRAYDPSLLALSAPSSNNEQANIEPMMGSYLGSQWGYFVFSEMGSPSYYGWDIHFYNANANPQDIVIGQSFANELQPRLSRQINKVVFISDRDNHDFEIFTINPDGTGLKQLTNNSSNDIYPNFSPDGSQIVFQSYRDGQAEIYKMKIDGTAVTRLTTNSAANTNYDGMPAWSPDDSQIAFVTNRSGQYSYQLWLMNADGTNQHLLADQPWCAHPVWSSDGTKIAFDAAVSMTAYQSIWIYSFDTGQIEQVAASKTNENYEVNAFMPGGRFVGFTTTSYDPQTLAPIINSLMNYGVEIQDHTGQIMPMLFNQGVVGDRWSFDWQSLDTLPPVTTTQPLPAISPTPFVLQWGAQDAGPAGIDSYELQTKASPGDAWHDVSSYEYQSGTSLMVTGTHGQSFYYRVRAIDKAGNAEAWKPENEWATTIESQPPHFVFYPSARYAPSTGTLLNWQEWDDGGSGIDKYEFRASVDSNCDAGQYFYGYKDHLFFDAPGRDWLFCARVTDRAGNVSNWAVMPNKVAFYYSDPSGHALNNQGIPVSGAQVDLSANQLAVFPSDINGNFMAYTNADYSSSTLGLIKSGYGSPTRWVFLPELHPFKDIYLPPADDLIANGGFEKNFSAADWQAGGNPLPELDPQSAYIGSFAAKLGGSGFSAPVSILNNCQDVCSPQFAVSSTGAIHVVWQHRDQNTGARDIYYAQKPNGGVWSSPQRIVVDPPNDPQWLGTPELVITPDDTLHMVFTSSRIAKLYSMSRPQNGSWSAPAVLFDNTFDYTSIAHEMTVDHNGTIHLILSVTRNTDSNFYYLKWSGGAWSYPINIGGTFSTSYGPEFSIVLDKDNLLAVVWRFYDSNPYLTRQTSPGTWTTPAEIPLTLKDVSDFKLAVDGAGTIHMTFENKVNTLYSLYYSKLDYGKSDWTPPTLLGPYSDVHLIATADGKVHLIWQENNNEQKSVLKYRIFTPGIGWSDIETPFTPQYLPGYSSFQFAIDKGPDGSLYFFVQNFPVSLCYFRRTAEGIFTNPQLVSEPSNYMDAIYIVVTPDNQPQLFWGNTQDYINATLYYSARQVAAQDGASTLSQTVSIPDTMQTPGLSFVYQVFGPPGSGSDFKVTVTDGAGTSILFTAAEENRGYQHTWVDMSQWKGKQVTLTFSMSHHQGQPNPEAMLDEVSLGETYPDGWIDFSPADVRGLPAQEVTLTLRYGAHGLPIDQAAISLQLPTGIEFVSASPQLAVTGDTLSWDVGNLSPQDGDQSINLVVRVKPDAPAFNAFDLKACLASPTAELETMNNCAQNTIRSALSNFMPVINK